MLYVVHYSMGYSDRARSRHNDFAGLASTASVGEQDAIDTKRQQYYL